MTRAVIADDSALLRQVLTDALENSGKISVIAAAKNGKEAVELVKTLKPDILILDCEMPVMNGLEALRKIMDESPLPVFIFSSLASEGSSVTIRALEYGAVDYLLKPTRGALGIDEVVGDLIRKVEYIVLKSKFKYLHSKPGASPVKPAVKSFSPKKVASRHIDLIAMGSSTGGVQAAMKVVPNLPENSKPVVWVQHMPPNFTKSFADRLNSTSKMRVKEAEDGDVLEQGHCYLAPGGFQMRLRKDMRGYRIVIGGTEKVSGHCPSCNVLFDSVAEYFNSNVLGVILTGMGDDGTKGLTRMHAQGAYVIGQNESSCVVYGMPKTAFNAGAVDIEMDINDIADGIVQAGGAG